MRTAANLFWGLLGLLLGRLAAAHCRLRGELRRRAEAQARRHLRTSCRDAATLFIQLNELAPATDASTAAASGNSCDPAGRVASGMLQLVAQYVARPAGDGRVPETPPAADMLAGLVTHLPGDCRDLALEVLLSMVARQPLIPNADPLPESPALEAAAAAVLVRALRLAFAVPDIRRFYDRVEHDRRWDGRALMAAVEKAERAMVAQTLP